MAGVVWRESTVAVSCRRQPQLGSLIRQSLLRHAPIALTLNSDLLLDEVAAIPRLWQLIISFRCPAGLVSQLLALPSLQGLQVLQLPRRVPVSALQLLPTLPALQTLAWCDPDEAADWRWLPAMPALTDLDLTFLLEDFSPPLVDAIGQCTQLQSLRLDNPRFQAGAFTRLCSTPAMRQLRHLDLARVTAGDGGFTGAECRAAFTALEQLESLRLKDVAGVDRLLRRLVHAPALRTLGVACAADAPVAQHLSFRGPANPSCDALRRLLTAAPLLHVELKMASTIDQWRNFGSFQHSASAADLVQFDDQWHELHRMGAEIERVTIVHADA